MRVAEISTLHRPVPPEGEGSIENIVSILAEGLVRKGHEVTLFAAEDSRTSARLRSPVRVTHSRNASMWDWQTYESFQVREAFRVWKDFDVIHCHSYHFGLLFCDLVPIPSLHSIHIEPGPDYLFLAANTRNRRLHFCSRYQARDFADIAGVHVIPHGIDLANFPAPAGTPGDYLAYLGRFLPDKGPLEAIRIAKQCGIPLKLAGPPNEYLRTVLEPEFRGAPVEYIGEVQGKAKADFLRDALALLYPLQWGEPFGLVLIEAMACGVPVVATNRGAVPEIVSHGKTGWLGETEADLAEAVEIIADLDRAAIRRHVEEHFSSDRMVERIEKLLVEMSEGAKS